MKYLDHASIASLCRSLIENAAVVRYVGDINISEGEWLCRRYVIDMHDYRNRTTFLSLMGQVPTDTKKYKFLEERLENNSFFQTLAPNRQKRLLNGEDMFIDGRHSAMLIFGWGDETHSLSMAFHRTELNRLYEEDSDYAKGVAAFSLEFARRALGFASLHMISLFPYVEAEFDPSIYAALKAEYTPQRA